MGVGPVLFSIPVLFEGGFCCSVMIYCPIIAHYQVRSYYFISNYYVVNIDAPNSLLSP
ncbi:hypothetical protein NC651_006738 [Populus alba x Populus x berolinensis]|nr:hypothetical protein NC651_006738 [Populus alba x Populus x berolinensis]